MITVRIDPHKCSLTVVAGGIQRGAGDNDADGDSSDHRDHGVPVQSESCAATPSSAASRALVAITGEHRSLCRLLLRRMIMRQRGVLRHRACQGGPVRDQQGVRLGRHPSHARPRHRLRGRQRQRRRHRDGPPASIQHQYVPTREGCTTRPLARCTILGGAPSESRLAESAH